MLGFFTLVFHQVKVEIRPLISSKLTTLFQLTTVFTMLGSALLPLPSWAYMVLFLTAAGFSIYSGARYLRTQSRFRYDADVRFSANGFRVLRELQ